MKKLLFLLILLLISSCTYTGETTLEKELEGPYLVTKVVDGDTADIVIDGVTERLRFSGINTPETEVFYL
jgi:endonuclease YncB( thermonuclease family)